VKQTQQKEKFRQDLSSQVIQNNIKWSWPSPVNLSDISVQKVQNLYHIV